MKVFLQIIMRNEELAKYVCKHMYYELSNGYREMDYATVSRFCETDEEHLEEQKAACEKYVEKLHAHMKEDFVYRIGVEKEYTSEATRRVNSLYCGEE